MKRELQDYVWSILPKEFKEEVKRMYRIADSDVDQMIAMIMLENVFGHQNLTSKAEGEEMLTVPRKKVKEKWQRACEQEAKYGRAQDSPAAREVLYYNRGILSILDTLFGTKCLPDKEEKMTEEHYQYLNSLSLEDYDNETSADEQRQFCEYQHKHHPDEVIYFQTHSDEKPKTAEPKFKVEDKVTVIDYNKGLPNLSRCAHKIFTVATVKWENSGYMYTLKTNEKLFKKSDYLDHLDWCEDYLEPYVEPEINTFKDLRKSGKYNRYLLCNDRYQEIALECMNPYERKMFATGIIAQLKEYYGGMVPFPQPIGCAKIVLCPDTEKFEVDIYRDWDALMTFHNIEQAERFLKYNEQLVRDYYMLPRKEESC